MKLVDFIMLWLAVGHTQCDPYQKWINDTDCLKSGHKTKREQITVQAYHTTLKTLMLSRKTQILNIESVMSGR